MPARAKVDPAIDERWFGALDRVLELVVLINDDMTKSLARDGLTTSRTHVLWVLRKTGPASQRVLAEAVGVSARTMTGLVDGLVATGFVTRQPHPTDRRAALVTFTPLGERTMAAMERDHREFAHLLFADLPERQFAGLVAGLDHLLARLKEHGLTPAPEGAP